MKYLITVIMILFSVQTASAGRVFVVDGDTVVVGGVTYQLIGIDSPEITQQCRYDNGKLWDCGEQAAMFLDSVFKDEDVTCVDEGRDDAGRVFSHCALDDGSVVGEVFVAGGISWPVDNHSNPYAGMEKTAIENTAFIWGAGTETAWDYRARLWAETKKTAPDGCPIKAMPTMRNGAIYFAPWAANYARMEVDTGHGGKWFCSEKAARDAGYEEMLWGQ